MQLRLDTILRVKLPRLDKAGFLFDAKRHPERSRGISFVNMVAGYEELVISLSGRHREGDMGRKKEKKCPRCGGFKLKSDVCPKCGYSRHDKVGTKNGRASGEVRCPREKDK